MGEVGGLSTEVVVGGATGIVALLLGAKKFINTLNLQSLEAVKIDATTELLNNLRSELNEFKKELEAARDDAKAQRLERISLQEQADALADDLRKSRIEVKEAKEKSKQLREELEQMKLEVERTRQREVDAMAHVTRLQEELDKLAAVIESMKGKE